MLNVWFYLNGARFAVYVLNAILLFAESKNPQKNKRAIIATGCVMTYAAIYKVFFDFIWPLVPSPFMEYTKFITPQIVLIMIPLSLFVMMELTKLTRVRFATVVRHLTPPLAILAAYIAAIFNQPSLTGWVFCFFLLYTAIYTVFFVLRLRMAYLRYSKEVEDMYATEEGRSLYWFPTLLGIFIGLEIIYLFLNVVVGTQYSDMFYTLLCMVLWSFLCYYIRQMKRVDKIMVLSSNEYGIDTATENGNEVKTNTEVAPSTEDLNDIMNRLYALFENKTLLTMESLNREDVARRIKTTNTALTKAIKNTTGMTFASFIGDLRLQYAADLLFSTDDTIESVIVQSGHTSKPSFYRGFTLKFGCTPSEYRKGNTAQRAK